MKRDSLFCAMVIIAVAVFSAAQSADNLITVGPNVQVSKPRAGQTHYEIQLSADPKDPMHLLGCSMVHSEHPSEPYPSQNSVVTYVSFDGGLTWQDTFELKGGPNIWEDPSCALGMDGAAYFAALGWDGISRAESPFYRSLDGGRSWTLAGEWPSGDREYITLDTTGGKFNGRLYLHSGGGARKLEDASAMTGLTIAHSVDEGSSLKPSKPLAAVAPSFVFGIGNGAVLSDGTLAIVFGVAKNFPAKYEPRPTEPNGWLRMVTSSDGSEHFSAATVISDWYMPTEHTLVGNVPALAVDSSTGPFRDRLYATWTDTRSGRYEILLAWSSDKGKTWSRPTVVNDDQAREMPGTGPDDCMPVVAVNVHGVVAVQWYDRREQPENLGWRTRLAVSLDGGESFSPSVKVSEAPFDNNGGDSWLLWGESSGGRTRIMFHPFHFYGGDTAGLAADAAGAFHPFWIDNRTGFPQIWTAGVTVRGTAAKNGAPELSDLEDVTDRVILGFSNLQYQPKLHTVTLDVSISNISKDTLLPPLKLRLLSLQSQFAGPQAANADNGLTGHGALWDLAALMPEKALKPGESTKPKRLQFKFDVLGPIRPQPDTIYPFQAGVLTFDARILAKISSKAGGPGN